MKEPENLRKDEPGALSENQPDTRQRILVVDDEVNTRRLNVVVLTQAGYLVEAASDGADGFEALQTGCFDLLITDNTMPKVTGVGLLKKMRASQMSLPTIMATGLAPTAEFARQPWLQPDATLVRPYTARTLLETVAVVLRMADAREKVQTPTTPPREPSGNSLEQ